MPTGNPPRHQSGDCPRSQHKKDAGPENGECSPHNLILAIDNSEILEIERPAQRPMPQNHLL
jgi:hypothetical protein